MSCDPTPSAAHQALIARRSSMFTELANRILAMAPEASSIWCYGINALRPERPTNDWDFIVFVADSCSLDRLNQLNHLEGPLASLRQVGTQFIDVQAIHASDRSPCARLIRREGFCIWHKRVTNQAAA